MDINEKPYWVQAAERKFAFGIRQEVVRESIAFAEIAASHKAFDLKCRRLSALKLANAAKAAKRK